MTQDPMIESYLSEVESHLSGRISVSEKAEIITEVKARINLERERKPELAMVDLLGQIGRPKEVANHYLSQKGLSPSGVSKGGGSFFKWLLIGFLALIAISLIFTSYLVYKFIPDVQNIGDSVGIQAGEVEDYIDLEGIKQVEISFTNGEVEVEWLSTQTQLHYSCDFMGSSDIPFTFKRDERDPSLLKASGVPSVGVDCEIKLPSKMSLHLLGANGSIQLSPDSAQTYEIRTHVSVGAVKNTPKSVNQSTLIDVKLQNGEIRFK
jgi:hypothetical protein